MADSAVPMAGQEDLQLDDEMAAWFRRVKAAKSFRRSPSPDSDDSDSNDPVQEPTEEELAEALQRMLVFAEERRRFLHEFCWDPELMKPLPKPSDDAMDKLYEKMRCQDCNEYPFPDHLYRCARGHFFCGKCYDKRKPVVTSESSSLSPGPSSGPSPGPSPVPSPSPTNGEANINGDEKKTDKDVICGFKMRPMYVDIVGKRHGQLYQEEKTGFTEEEIKRVEEEEKAGRCLQVLKHYADHWYLTRFNTSKWRCSFCENDGFLGKDIMEHMGNCSGFREQYQGQ